MTELTPNPESRTPPVPRKVEERPRPWSAHWFFTTDNPIWTLFPILLSITALWFAYKSNIISRETADAHLRITNQAFMGYYMGKDYFVEDGDYYFPSVIGSLENIEELMDTVTLATNDLSMKWLAESVGMDLESMDVEDLPFTQYYLFMAITNDGNQIAEDMKIEFDYYRAEDKTELRGEDKIPPGITPDTWIYGPSLLAPGSWVIIPLGTCYVRLNPQTNKPQVQYFGDFYIPKNITYTSAVSGTHTRALDYETIPQTMNAFTKPQIPIDENSDSVAGDSGSSAGSGTGSPDRENTSTGSPGKPQEE